MSRRPDWPVYFMRLANLIASRATCPRRAVGAIFERDRRMLATGYNGSPTGAQHCTDVGCLMDNGHCRRTVHAETNAIATAARHGVSLLDSTLYVTTLPCWTCYLIVKQVGTRKIVYRDDYHSKEVDWVLEDAKLGHILIQKGTDK